MNTYHVYLRKGGQVIVTAAGYTESRRTKRIYFYGDAARKDRQTFFHVRDIEGVHAFETQTLPATVDLPSWLAERRAREAAQASNSQH